MHYYAYELAHTVLSPLRLGMSGLRSMLDSPFNPLGNTPYGRHLAAACELFENVTRRYGKPEFGLKTTYVGGVEVAVREQLVASTPFGRLLHFKRDETALTGKRYDPKVLIVAPMSGPLCDAAARHRQGDAARPRSLHHRLGRRARHPARHGPLRPRRLHRSRHRVHSRARPRYARHRRMPAGRAGARRRGAHGARSTIHASPPR